MGRTRDRVQRYMGLFANREIPAPVWSHAPGKRGTPGPLGQCVSSLASKPCTFHTEEHNLFTFHACIQLPSHSLNPKPRALHSQSPIHPENNLESLIPQPQTPNPKLGARATCTSATITRRRTAPWWCESDPLRPQPSTPNPQPPALNPQPSNQTLKP